MNGRLPIALVGCGRAAERLHAPAIARCRGLELVAVVDVDARRSEALSRSLPGRPQALQDPASLEGIAEAAVVATPPGTHAHVASVLAQAGVRCLVEKPPALNHPDARAMAELSPRPYIGFNRRFVWPGIVGEIESRRAGLDMEGSIEGSLGAWGAHSPQGDALSELGCHLVDLALVALDGMDLIARCSLLEPGRARFELSAAGAVARLSCDGDARWRERVVLASADGPPRRRYRAGGMRGALATRLGRGDLLRGTIIQLEAFAAAVRGEPAAGLASAAEGARVMAVVEAIRESASAVGEPVAVAAS